MPAKSKKLVTRAPRIYERVREILESARASAARSVNTTQVVANWLVGREIVEEEQRGKPRADYGEKLLEELSSRLGADYGSGFSVQNLRYVRQFFLSYPSLLIGAEIRHAVRGVLPGSGDSTTLEIRHAVRGEFGNEKTSRRQILHASRGESLASPRISAQRNENWRPGRLHPNLSWTHYRTLLRVGKAMPRAFYEIEALRNSWSARELERQINSLLYERLVLSKHKKDVMKLASRGQEVMQPIDAFKDPVVIEFLGLPESPSLVESTLEQGLIDNLQVFLLELGKGFAFVSRQERITLDGDHFYIDLVFYHTILKCYVLVDLKVGKLTHQDIGQTQFYVNYFDRERRTEGDQPTAVVKYTLGEQQKRKIFTSRYQLYLPTEKELENELRREMRQLAPPEAKPARKRTRKS